MSNQNQNTEKDNDPSVTPVRLIGNLAAKLFLKTNITPNDITLGKFIILLPFTLFFLAKGGYLNNLIALGLIFVNSVFDSVDGAIARAKSLKSKLGAWMDGMLDVYFLNLVLIAVAWNVVQTTGEPLWFFGGLFALFGQDLSNIMGSFFERKFGFDCYSGSANFRKKFIGLKKISLLDHFLKNIIVPSNFLYTFFFTCRYLFVLGIISNRLDLFLVAFAILINIRGIAMSLIYALYLSLNKTKFYTIKFLREIDAQR